MKPLRYYILKSTKRVLLLFAVFCIIAFFLGKLIKNLTDNRELKIQGRITAVYEKRLANTDYFRKHRYSSNLVIQVNDSHYIKLPEGPRYSPYWKIINRNIGQQITVYLPQESAQNFKDEAGEEKIYYDYPTQIEMDSLATAPSSDQPVLSYEELQIMEANEDPSILHLKQIVFSREDHQTANLIGKIISFSVIVLIIVLFIFVLLIKNA